MTYTIETGHSSPNYGERYGAEIRMLVVHATVGSYNSSLGWLCNPLSRVSSHYLIRKDGHIAQLVADRHVAWHAGASSWHGLNKDAIALGSLGIELENLTGMEDFHGQDPYPTAQLAALHWLCAAKIAKYGIDRSMVVRHVDIAPGRKTDPAGFPDWPGFVASLYGIPPLNPPVPPASPSASYRVRAGVTAGARVRTAPRQTAAVVRQLRPGDTWAGTRAQGDMVTQAGFQTGDVWIKDAGGRFVWLGLLELVQ